MTRFLIRWARCTTGVFTDDEIRQFEEYLQRIQRNLEEKLKP